MNRVGHRGLSPIRSNLLVNQGILGSVGSDEGSTWSNATRRTMVPGAGGRSRSDDGIGRLKIRLIGCPSSGEAVFPGDLFASLDGRAVININRPVLSAACGIRIDLRLRGFESHLPLHSFSRSFVRVARDSLRIGGQPT